MVCRPWQGSINTQPESENKVTWPTVVKWEGDLPDLENESELLIRPDAPATLYSFEQKDNTGIFIIDEVEITKRMIEKCKAEWGPEIQISDVMNWLDKEEDPMQGFDDGLIEVPT